MWNWPVCVQADKSGLMFTRFHPGLEIQENAVNAEETLQSRWTSETVQLQVNDLHFDRVLLTWLQSLTWKDDISIPGIKGQIQDMVKKEPDEQGRVTHQPVQSQRLFWYDAKLRKHSPSPPAAAHRRFQRRWPWVGLMTLRWVVVFRFRSFQVRDACCCSAHFRLWGFFLKT